MSKNPTQLLAVSGSPKSARDAEEQRTVMPSRCIRVGVICDFLEERWPSMDLVADMLCHHLAGEAQRGITVKQLRPALRRRITRIPFLPDKVAWNADRLLNRFVDY